MIRTCKAFHCSSLLDSHWLKTRFVLPAPTPLESLNSQKREKKCMFTTYLHGEKKVPPPHGRQTGNALNTYTTRTRKNILAPTIVLLHHSPVPFRDNGTEQMKSVDRCYTTIYILYRIYNHPPRKRDGNPNEKSMHQQGPSGNRFRTPNARENGHVP